MVSCGEFLFVFIFVFTVTDLALECKTTINQSCKVQGLCYSEVIHITFVFIWFGIDYLITTVLILDERHLERMRKVQKLCSKVWAASIAFYFYYYIIKRTEPEVLPNQTDSDPLTSAPMFSQEYLNYVNCFMPEAMSYGDIYFGMYLLLFVGMLLIVICAGISKVIQNYKEGKFDRELEKILVNAYMEPQPLKNFYEKNKNSLQGMPLFKTEVKVFKDQFECEFQHSKKQDYSQCIICFADLEPEEKCIGFPGCGHNYHFDCLSQWLDNGKTVCPVCKLEFRPGFAEDLCKKMETQFIKVPSLDGG